VRQHLLKIILCAVPVFVCSPATATDAATTTIPGVASDQSSKNVDAERAMMAADPVTEPPDEAMDGQDSALAEKAEEVHDKEEIWSEISDAIASLNDVVGDEMFLDLRRKENNQMEVRVDIGFWQRVRYQTRVDLKKDISNIWHLYVKQYYDGDYSAVHFIDDSTEKTIDIFTQSK